MTALPNRALPRAGRSRESQIPTLSGLSSAPFIEEGSPIRVAQEEFNQTYGLVLYLLQQAFNGDPSQIQDVVGAMFGLRKQALAQTKMPTSDGKTTAGQSFEYVPPEQRN